MPASEATGPKGRAIALFRAMFEQVAHGGSWPASANSLLTEAVDALIDTVRPPAEEPGAPQVGSLTLSIGRLLDTARSLNDPADLNPPYLDGQVKLIWRAAELGPALSVWPVSVEPLAERLRRTGAIDMQITGRGLLEAARPLIPPGSTHTEFVRGVVELACEALGLDTDDYRAQVEDTIRAGLPWHGFLRPPALYHARERLNAGQGSRPRTSRAVPDADSVPSLRFMIRMARKSGNGQCENWAMGQARLICDLAGLPHAQHAGRIADLITAPPATAECKWCHAVIRRDDLGDWVNSAERKHCAFHGGYAVDRAIHQPEPCTITETEQP